MKSITKYVADDGSEWETEEEAMDRGESVRMLRKGTELLGDVYVDGVGWKQTDGEGYIQHDRNIVPIVKDHLIAATMAPLRFAFLEGGPWEGLTEANLDKVHPSAFHALLSGLDLEEFQAAWHRLWCIDSHGREWFHPWWVGVDREGVQCLEDRR